ncbi:deoxyuridine 5 -triphosphate nucleotidohydrolase, putative [Babesia ovata]|uniref:Deoxyuridine 5-triphosphate nucleotidohydrolase, putative n=1 Tax=Babesia ovata TaxID=189622 RepID=A0A2H6KEU0_9APIC|nr:deoxyuridine 5 -triphosphate nucleotidohydrolase, putative [Babesia ovata]GBE61513.1 deoxyuridine 5 -triphosphate nucleotidohydrolase, putative [Babesia ovata]
MNIKHLSLGVDLDAAHFGELRALNPDVQDTVRVGDGDRLVQSVVGELEAPVEVTDLALTDVDVEVVAEFLVKLVLGAGAANDEFSQSTFYGDIVVAETGQFHQNNNLVSVSVKEGVNGRVEGNRGFQFLGSWDLQDGVLRNNG